MKRTERMAAIRRQQAEKIAARLRGLFQQASVTYRTEEQRKGPAVMRVRLNYETETFLVSAVVSVRSDSTFGAVVVATSYNPATDTLRDTINTGRDVLYSIPDVLGFVESTLNSAFQCVA